MKNKSNPTSVLSIECTSTVPMGILSDITTRFTPIAAFACFSGGHDSLVSTHWAMNNIPGCQVLHCNTGIGIEQTREYVRNTCKEYGWPLIEEKQEGVYEQFVINHGFPGPPQHPRMYQRLKERSIRRICKRAKEGYSRRSHVLYVSGVHAGESLIRAAYDRPGSKVGSQIWINPFYYSPIEEFDDYRNKHSLPLNEVKLKIGMSGECGCGAFATKGELELWGTACPRFVERIKELERKAREAGHDWGWEDHRPKWINDARRGQTFFPFMPMCAACCKRDELLELEIAKTSFPKTSK